MDRDEAAQAFREFVRVIQALRTPGTGCPWDLEQDHATLRPYLIEETYEVLDAIDRADDRAFREELGDLLLQVVLHAQVADDRGAFSITEVVRGISEKMVRRHPHVFGSVRVSGSDEVRRNWEQIKAAEKSAQGEPPSSAAALDRVPESLPALLRAQRLGEKAGRVNIDWGSLGAGLEEVGRAFAGLEEEVGAVLGELPGGGAAPADGSQALPGELRLGLERRLGDLLFSLCQLARWLGLGAEDSLRARNQQFVDRCRRPDGTPVEPVPTPPDIV